MKIVYYIILFVIIIALYEILHQCYRQYERKNLFKLAKQRSIELSKPLVVIGDPTNGGGSKLWGKTYSGGDYCIDLTGCPNEKQSINIKGDVVQSLRENFKDNSSVIYVSCVLEYVENIEECISELKRVAGDNMFIVTVSPYCLMSRFYFMKLGDVSLSKNIIYSAPPYSYFKYTRI